MDSNPDKKHLFIVMTSPTGPLEEVLLFSISTYTGSKKQDSTCLLEPAEHPFISRPSYVYYRGARIERLPNLMRALDSGLFVRKEQVSEELFHRIVDGMYRSKAIRPLPIDFYEDAQRYV
tara:strand:- start:306 stop:665 length:360 start_codon:yes stop_codon:yes gene_type:complete